MKTYLFLPGLFVALLFLSPGNGAKKIHFQIQADITGLKDNTVVGVPQ